MHGICAKPSGAVRLCKATDLAAIDTRQQRFTRQLSRLKATYRDDRIIPDAYQEVITVMTTDGRLVRIPGNNIRRPQRPLTQQAPMPTWGEQKLCIGASFILAATNGHDPARRINLEGFCQSIDYLFESIEDTVKTQRGEILWEERELKSGLHEILKVTVSVPFLWGVPPQLETLSDAIQSGGGVVHRMYHQWVVSY